MAIDEERLPPPDLGTPLLLLMPADAADADDELGLSIDEALPLGGGWWNRPTGVLSRAASSSQLAAAAAAVAAGLIVLQPGFAQRLAPGDLDFAEAGSERFRESESQLPLDPLSPRELAVLRLLADGLSNKGIASRLDLSEHTVKFHLNSLFEKLAVHNRTEAVSTAIRLGLVAL